MAGLVLDVAVLEGERQSEPGAVDQHVDRSCCVRETVHDGGDADGGGEVGGEHLDRCGTGAGQFPGQLLEPGLVAGDEHEVVAAASELAGVFGTEPGAGTGDQGRRCHGGEPMGDGRELVRESCGVISVENLSVRLI